MAETIRLGDDQWLTSETGTPLTYTNDVGGIEGHILASARSSSKTAYGRDGYMYDVPTNEPAICFKKDPRGALMTEPEDENTVQYSDRMDFDTGGYNAGGWTVNGAGTLRTHNAVVSPRGTQDATLFEGSVTSAGVYGNSGLTTSSFQYSAMVHLKFISGTSPIRINFEQGFSGNAKVVINSDGTIKESTFTSATRIEVLELPNGWFEVKMNGFGATSGTQGTLSLYKDSISGTEQWSVWGVNRVLGGEIHSHIPTEGGVATRAADTTYRAVHAKHLYDSQSGGIEVEYIPSLAISGSSRLSTSDDTFSNRLFLQEKTVENGLGGNFGFITGNGTSNFSSNFVITGRDTQKVAVSYGAAPELVINGVSELRRDDTRNFDADTLSTIDFDDPTSGGGRRFIGGLVSYRAYNDALDIVNVKSTRDELLTDSKYNVQ